MSQTPIGNLKEPHFQPSSLSFGVDGESQNAPYGPKAFDATTIEALKDFGDRFEANKKVDGFAVGKLTGLPEPTKETSSVKP